jgi:hypothetical protein
MDLSEKKLGEDYNVYFTHYAFSPSNLLDSDVILTLPGTSCKAGDTYGYFDGGISCFSS